ncbi:MAG TPA: YggS family pyridoxal phosphate-dependent enzyme [Ohtaekwangia sp.]|nr:YggS family pyridoxal phosphate-dependent enzyme [Ohtaekwangia sp.]
MNIKNNINYFRQNIPQGCKLITVSKTQPVERLLEAYNRGQRIFGENKVQELVPKYEALPKDIEWHMIGHLQSNKVKYIAPFITLIHAVDSLSLLKEINKQAQRNQRVIACLLQVHIAEEESKFGFSEEDILQLFVDPGFLQLNHISIMGLMGMATFTENEAQVRKEFTGLGLFFRKLQAMNLPAQVKMKELSMGMSGDYNIAIEAGSTLVRIGTAIFGERDYSKK